MPPSLPRVSIAYYDIPPVFWAALAALALASVLCWVKKIPPYYEKSRDFEAGGGLALYDFCVWRMQRCLDGRMAGTQR